jgi:hypothetical protein
MSTMSGNPGGNLTGGAGSSESDTAHLVARARVMMVISALTTLLAIAAVVVVIGYRVFNTRGVGPGSGAVTDSVLTLPKGAHVVSTSVTASYIAVTLDIGGVAEVRIFDRKTLQPVGRLHFGDEKP